MLNNTKITVGNIGNLRGQVVCCDLDNSIVNCNSLLYSMGYDIKNLYPCPGLDENFWLSDKGLYVLSEAKPIVETYLLIRHLIAVGCEVVYATRRNYLYSDITHKWLSERDVDGEVYFLEKDICKSIVKANKYIDDSPAEIISLLESGKEVIIPKWNYNESIKSNRTTHMHINNGI